MNERDPELDARWRKHSTETPAPALDDAIRAAAHRAVRAAASPVRSRAPWPTWATFAAAASIGAIAVGVWQLLPRDADETQVVASDVPARAAPAQSAAAGAKMPASSAAPADAKSPAAASTPSDASLRPAARDARPSPGMQSGMPTPNVTPAPSPARENPAVRIPPPAPADAITRYQKSETVTLPAADGSMADKVGRAPEQTQSPVAKPSPFPAAGEPASQSMTAPFPAAGETRSRSAPAPAVAPVATPRSANAAQAQSAAAELSAHREPVRAVNDYVDAIRRALAEHRDVDAAAALTAMRARYADADAQLPADLREWAARVPRASQ